MQQPDNVIAGHVTLSRFEVREGFEDAVAASFRSRPHLVEETDGFLRLDVLRPSRASAGVLVAYLLDRRGVVSTVASQPLTEGVARVYT